MEKVYIKDGVLNYFGEGKKVEISQEDKRKMEFEGFIYEDGELIAPAPKELTKEEKIVQINSETREKILSRYSESDQVNLQREAQLIFTESVLRGIPLTDSQIELLNEAKIAHEYIKQCLAEGKQKILELP